MEKINYQELLSELDNKVSVFKNTDNGFELESEYFKSYDNENLKKVLNDLDLRLKVNLNSLITFIALYDAKRTESSKQIFLNHLKKVFNNCKSEKDFLILQSVFDQLALVGGIAKEDAFIYSRLIKMAKKRWQKGLTIDNKPKNNENEAIEQFKEQYRQVSDLCQRVLNSSTIKEDELYDTIEQIGEIQKQFNDIFNQLSEKERTEIDQDIQNMINSATNIKDLIEEEKNLWTK